MKLLSRTILFIICFSPTITTMAGMGGGGGGGGGGGCQPFSPCWCASRPGHPSCAVPVPIDGGTLFLAIAGLSLGIYFILKKKKKGIKA